MPRLSGLSRRQPQKQRNSEGHRHDDRDRPGDGGVYRHIRFAPYRRLARAVSKGQWPATDAVLDLVRRVVMLDIGLCKLAFVLAVLRPAL